ncbi:MAG: hypothetical protein ACTSWQ_06655 [Candidatus Thorarchaeota archaeon]
MKFNRKVKWTELWRDAVLRAIQTKRKHLYSQSTCVCCALAIDHCEECVLGDGEHMLLNDMEYSSWCKTYWNMQLEENETGDKAMIAYLDKMERAVNRRKVVK